jgi:hypothetical protein
MVPRHPTRIPPCLVALTLALAACSKSPAEPDAPERTAPAPKVAPLTWTAPASWTALDAPRNSPKKAGYRVEKAGADKEDAELSVFFFGTGDKGDPEKNFTEWLGQFDGKVGPTAKRETFEANGLKLETVEVAGTYKVPLAPPVGRQKKVPVQMVKNDWRMIGAVVKTPDRGNWFFKLVGPNETVQASRSAFRTMLESAR